MVLLSELKAEPKAEEFGSHCCDPSYIGEHLPFTALLELQC